MPDERAALVPVHELARQSHAPAGLSSKAEIEQAARPAGARPGAAGGVEQRLLEAAGPSGRRTADQRLLDAQMVAVAGCFRDLTTSPLQVRARVEGWGQG